MLVDVAKNALQAMTSFAWPTELHLPGYRPVTTPHGKQIREAVRLLLESRRPVLYVGGGTIRSGAHRELLALAELTGIPVVTTLMARGAFPDSHVQHLGMPGMHGTVAAVAGLQKSDLIISLGARFDDRVTGNLDSFAPGAKVIHADIDPAEIGKNRIADVPIVGDVREVLTELLAQLRTEADAGHTGDYEAWVEFVAGIKKAYPLGYDTPAEGLAPQYVIERRRDRRPPTPSTPPASGSTRCGRRSSSATRSPAPGSTPVGLGTMGYSVPAAMGAKVGCPDTTVWAIDGDGCFQMTNQELATCTINDIPIKVAIINNESARHGAAVADALLQRAATPRQPTWQSRRRSSGRVPDFVKLADAYGCVGLSCDSPEDVDATIHKAMGINDVPSRLGRLSVVHRDDHGLADGRRRLQQRRDPLRPRPSPPASTRTTYEHPTTFFTSPAALLRRTTPRGPRSPRGRWSGMTTHTLSVLVEDKPGVLARIAGLFSRRSFNIAVAGRRGPPSTPRSRG